MDISRRHLPAAPINRISNWVEAENSNIANFNVPVGADRMLMVVVGAENGTTQATYNVTYNGIPLTRAYTALSVTGFTALLEIWYLKNSLLPAGASTANIIVTPNPFTSIEYFTSISAAVFENVDQANPFETTTQISSTTNTNTISFAAPINVAAGSMGMTAIFCGNNTNPTKTNGSTGCWTINSGFTERVDVYRSNPSVPGSGGCVQVADKSYALAGSDNPTFTFSGTPNRRVAVFFSFRRSGVYDQAVQMLKNGVPTGTIHAANNLPWPLVDTYQSYGGPTDLWGTSWSYLDINDIDFGVIMNARIEQGTALVNHLRITVFFSSVLPIDLVEFTAKKEDDENVLSWLTATEINSSSFEIEKSMDGFEFVSIETMSVAGTSNEPILYEYKDSRISSERCYYRLKMIDKDGTFKYSDIKSVEGAGASEDV